MPLTRSIARRAAVGLIVALLLSPATRADTPAPAQSTAATPPDLAVGQEWSIRGEPGAKAIVGWIEDRPDGKTAVNVSLIDIPTDRGTIVIGHAPFEKTVLVASLDKLLASGVRPSAEFQKGFNAWKSGSGGLFTITVAEALASLQSQLRAHPAQ